MYDSYINIDLDKMFLYLYSIKNRNIISRHIFGRTNVFYPFYNAYTFLLSHKRVILSVIISCGGLRMTPFNDDYLIFSLSFILGHFTMPYLECSSGSSASSCCWRQFLSLRHSIQANI